MIRSSEKLPENLSRSPTRTRKMSKKEKKIFEEAQRARDQQAAEDAARRNMGFNDDEVQTHLSTTVAVSIIHESKRALARCAELSEERAIPAYANKIFMRLLIGLGDKHILRALEIMNPATGAGPKAGKGGAPSVSPVTWPCLRRPHLLGGAGAVPSAPSSLLPS